MQKERNKFQYGAHSVGIKVLFIVIRNNTCYDPFLHSDSIDMEIMK